MNKIEVVNDKINKKLLDNSVSVNLIAKKSLFGISEINIEVLSDTDLFLNISIPNYTKLKINISVLNNINCNLFILESGHSLKIMYNYDIADESNISVTKYNSIDSINEMVQINLNGINSTIYYLFKSMSNNKENYDYRINHNAKNTKSNIKNHGVNIKGEMNIQISSTVGAGITNCTCNQFNRIINMTNNKCEIRPILYIDNDLVDANHSALVGNFDNDELFYLESRGIDKKSAYDLLIEGFIKSEVSDNIIKDCIDNDLKKYWR